jgi:hypothetical protein
MNLLDEANNSGSVALRRRRHSFDDNIVGSPGLKADRRRARERRRCGPKPPALPL